MHILSMVPCQLGGSSRPDFYNGSGMCLHMCDGSHAPNHPFALQMKQYRKDIAELLRAGKQDYARIRVEAVIREAFTLTGVQLTGTASHWHH